MSFMALMYLDTSLKSFLVYFTVMGALMLFKVVLNAQMGYLQVILVFQSLKLAFWFLKYAFLNFLEKIFGILTFLDPFLSLELNLASFMAII